MPGNATADNRHNMLKTVHGDMQTVKVQIRLRIRAIGSGPSLSLAESLDTTKYLNREQSQG